MKNIYFNGKVYTGELPLVEAFVEENGKFVFLWVRVFLPDCVDGIWFPGAW